MDHVPALYHICRRISGWIKPGDTLETIMTRTQAVALGSGSALFGGGLLAYLVLRIPPRSPDGEANVAVLLLALLCLLLLAGGIGTLAALALHNRWPALAGARPRMRPSPTVAVRQGALTALGAGAIVLLAYARMLDAAYLAVTVLILILFEAFVQSRA